MICPNCQNEQAIGEQHYGALYTCSSCQAVYFINFEGQPEYSNDIPETISAEQLQGPAEPAAASPAEQMPPLSMPDQNMTGLEPAAHDLNQLPPQEMSLGQDFNSNQMSQDLASPISEPVPTAEAPLAADNISMEPAIEQEQPVSPPAVEMPPMDLSNPDVNPFEAAAAAQPVAPAKPKTFSDIAGEISDFGNTEVQLAGLNYDLKITGIDTQETMKLFIEAIQDSKFGWDHNEIIKTVKNGAVEFTKLSPVKAYILAKRIQFLDIEKHWKQNVMS